MSSIAILDMTQIECGLCHVPFSLVTAHLRDLKRSGDWFWCPNGHKIHYFEDEVTRVKKELAEQTRRADEARADAEFQRRRVTVRDRQIAARKGQITKMRKRLSNGVCPCCNRYFAKLHAHMTTKHPEWTPEAPLPEEIAAVAEATPLPEPPTHLAWLDRDRWLMGASAAKRGEHANPFKPRGRGVHPHYRWQEGHDAMMTVLAFAKPKA